MEVRIPILQVEVIPCTFIRRINRFVGEAIIEGKNEKLHITNTGRLKEFLVNGRRCLATPINGKKLRYRLVAVEDIGEYAVIDTRTQSKAFEAAVDNEYLCFFHKCRIKSREPKGERGRFDYLLSCQDGNIIVETKSAVLRGGNNEAMYPDCPTLRGTRHVMDLIKLHQLGVRVALVFIGALPNARCFKPYFEGDPRLFEILSHAYNVGLPIHAFSMYASRSGTIYLEKPCLPLCNDWLESLQKKR